MTPKYSIFPLPCLKSWQLKTCTEHARKPSHKRKHPRPILQGFWMSRATGIFNIRGCSGSCGHKNLHTNRTSSTCGQDLHTPSRSFIVPLKTWREVHFIQDSCARKQLILRLGDASSWSVYGVYSQPSLSTIPTRKVISSLPGIWSPVSHLTHHRSATTCMLP